MAVGWWLTALLLCSRTAGMRCGGDAVLVYSRVGGNSVLPCANLRLSDCSPVSWAFFAGGGSWNSLEFREAQAGAGSNRVSITSNCSLGLRDLRIEDAGSYSCCKNGSTLVVYYLSVLTITSVSSIMSLQPGGNLRLDCVLYTYFDAGTCRFYSAFNVSWVSEDGTTLPRDNRTRLIENNRCNVTLVTSLETEDNNRKWRCQVNSIEEARAAFVDFTSAFVFESRATISAAPLKCSFRLPAGRVLLCVLLGLVVATAGVFTCRRAQDRVRGPAAGLQLLSLTTPEAL